MKQLNVAENERQVGILTVQNYKLSMSMTILQTSLHCLQQVVREGFLSTSDNRKSMLLEGMIS